MNIGKVPETILDRSVFKQLTVRRDEVITGPGIGIDCGIIDFSKEEYCVISCDPITAAVEDIGTLAVHITANDLASSGATPIGLMLTVMLPEGFSEGDLKTIMQDINKTCEALNLQIIGGHTEVTKAVNQPIISVAGIGKVHKSFVPAPSKVKQGQSIVMTKWAGIEGTAIIAASKEEVLKKHYNYDFIEGAKTFNQFLSVVPESKIAMDTGVSLMHDVTEGGIFGALWEIGASYNGGLEVELDKIPIRQETIEICEYYDLNPYKLISSGSLLIVTDNGKELVQRLGEEGIQAAIIGKITEGNERIIVQSDSRRSLYPPKADELYKVI